MSLEAFWKRLTTKQQTRERTLRERWEGTVAALADGKPPEVEAVAQVLADTGKSPQELEAAVDRLIRRRQARAALDKAKGVPMERDKLLRQEEEAAAAYNTVVEAAQAKFKAAYDPIQSRRLELHAIEKAGETAERLLLETADRPEVEAQIAALQKQLAETRGRRDQWQKGAGRLASEAESRRSAAGAQGTSEGTRAKYLEEALAREEGARESLAEASKIEPEVRQLEAQIAVLERTRLEP
jgi:hypothetical protein